VKVLAKAADVEYRIDHKLPGAVKGYVAAAIRSCDLDSFGLVLRAREQEIFLVKVGAEREDRIVLDEQQGVIDFAGFDSLGEKGLDFVCFVVASVTEVDDGAQWYSVAFEIM
jgi:hypothetical protein